jgi:hypothetical protein
MCEHYSTVTPDEQEVRRKRSDFSDQEGVEFT